MLVVKTAFLVLGTCLFAAGLPIYPSSRLVSWCDAQGLLVLSSRRIDLFAFRSNGYRTGVRGQAKSHCCTSRAVKTGIVNKKGGYQRVDDANRKWGRRFSPKETWSVRC